MAERQRGEQNINSALIGLNLNSQIAQVKQGELTFALNAVITNFDGNQVTYQNETSNVKCLDIPVTYKVIGRHNIVERDIIVLFLYSEESGRSEIGLIENNCTYRTLINASCLNFHINYPILKVAHKITNCGIEVYFTDKRNRPRWIDLYNLPFKETITECADNPSSEIDCNKLLVQPDFAIPTIIPKEVDSSGALTAGTYQFAIQYSNSVGEPYTSFYSITNPIPINEDDIITPNFDYLTGKSIRLDIKNLDVTGIYEYYNLAVIRTVNNITTPELVGTFQITKSTDEIFYSGQQKDPIKLAIEDIFFKTNVYEKAGDVTTVSDILVWSDLETTRRLDLQHIANQIKLQWQTFKMPADSYKDPIIAANYKGYMRDEIYAFEFVPILKGGLQGDKCHIPNREPNAFDLEIIDNADVIDDQEEDCSHVESPQPRWKVYNTATVLNLESNTGDECYIGPYQYGEFAYWESTEEYPCDPERWGDLAGKKIRHHKFPDSTVTHIHSGNAIYPVGLRIDVSQVWNLIQSSDKLTQEQKDSIIGFKITRGNRASNKSIVAKGLMNNVGKYERDEQTYFFPNYLYNDLNPDPYLSVKQTAQNTGANTGLMLNAFNTEDSKKRFAFHSPDTHFYQPYLGNILKLESIEHGWSKGNFTEVREHARYRFLTGASYFTALGFAVAISFVPTSINVGITGGGGGVAGPMAGVTAFNLFIDILQKVLPRRNFAYQYNSIGNYTNYTIINNTGNKQRRIDLGRYLIPGMQNIGDTYTINNYKRESSVYVRTNRPLLFPHEYNAPKDESKWTLGSNNNVNNVTSKKISSYYASIKRNILNLYGSIFSYESIDTGVQYNRNLDSGIKYVFGGDVFINKFAYKSKFPFFIDHRIKVPDDSDVFYDQLGNVAYPTYWFSTDVSEAVGSGGFRFFNDLLRVFGVKQDNFDDPNDTFFSKRGKIYLFAYGIPYFFCESEVNVDYRQASNGAEGDFYPRVSSDIPYDWFQEINVPIAQDNVYYYNKTYSKQNKENNFSYLPQNYTEEDCVVKFPNRAIFSESQQEFSGKFRNNWLVYKPASVFDFPLNYGKLTSLDGIEDAQVLARFENKSSLYNALMTTEASTGQIFLGQSIFDKRVPPLDYAETDLGYNGSQHKFMLKTEFGVISIDSKRGQAFLLQGRKATPILDERAGQFFIDNLQFQIKNHFPDVNIDNHFNGIGLHGVYDTRYDRVIITKLDYVPINKDIVHRDGKFYLNDVQVSLTDTNYFENKSFTFSFNFLLNSLVSFHSYLPLYYIGGNNVFFAGNDTSIWKHNSVLNSFCTFFGEKHKYIIEYPFNYQASDEIANHVSDYTKVLKYSADGTFVETDDKYFDKAILYNNQQCSGELTLVKKKANSLAAYMTYPKYTSTSKEIQYTKVNNQYNYNDFCDLVTDKSKPIFIYTPNSPFKEINNSNITYKKLTFKESPLVAKDLKVRHILTDSGDYKFLSQFIIVPTKPSIL